MHNADLVTDTNNGVICDIYIYGYSLCLSKLLYTMSSRKQSRLVHPKIKVQNFLLVLLSCCWLDGAKERRLDCILKYRSLQSQKYSVL